MVAPLNAAILFAAHAGPSARAVVSASHRRLCESAGVQTVEQFLQLVRVHEHDIVLRRERSGGRVENHHFAVHVSVQHGHIARRRVCFVRDRRFVYVVPVVHLAFWRLYR